MDPGQGKLVELRFFGGLSISDTAEVLGVSAATVKREWAVARAWLQRELGAGSERLMSQRGTTAAEAAAAPPPRLSGARWPLRRLP